MITDMRVTSMNNKHKIIKTNAPIVAVEGIPGSGRNALIKSIASAFDSSEATVFPLNNTLPFDSVKTPAELQLLMAFDKVSGCSGVLSRKASMHLLSGYKHSAYAQGMAQGVSLEWMISINSKIPDPDFVILIDTPVATCAKHTDTPYANLERERSCLCELLLHCPVTRPKRGVVRVDGSSTHDKIIEYLKKHVLFFVQRKKKG